MEAEQPQAPPPEKRTADTGTGPDEEPREESPKKIPRNGEPTAENYAPEEAQSKKVTKTYVKNLRRGNRISGKRKHGSISR